MNPPTYPFEETSFMDDPLCSTCQIDGEISSIFVAFLENTNFMNVLEIILIENEF